MKLIRQGIIGALALSLAATALSQTTPTDNQLPWVGARPLPTDLLSVTHDSLPDTGLTFYSVQRWNQIPPVPTDWTRKLPDSATASLTYYISPSFGTNRIIVDDRLVNYDQAYAELQNQRAVLNAASRLLGLPDEIIDQPGGQGMYSLQIPTDGSLWLEITNVTNGIAFLNLDNATNSVYAIWTTTDLLAGWQVDTEVWPTNQSLMPFMLSASGRTNLFVRAQDWTGVDSDADGIPDWWIWMNFGNLGLGATNLDSQGHTLWYDYTNGLNPNIISFSLTAPNSTVRQTAAPVQVSLYAGWPCYYSVLVNDTNHANALWLPYPGTNIIANLGATDGLYAVTIGLRGLPQSAQSAWQTIYLTLDQTPPAIHLTSPTNTAVPYPLIQLVGYSEEALSSITFAVGQHPAQRGCIISQYYDPTLHKITTNFWQCYDIPISQGTNLITVQATDLAGNVTTNVYTFTFSTNDLPPAPALSLTWPQDGMTISTNQISIQGQLDDPTVAVTLTLADINGTPWVHRALVERRGQFWFDQLPLSPGTNLMTMVATDAAGNSSTTNFTLVESDMLLAVNPVPQELLGYTNTTVTGIVQGDSFDVWVNGVQALVDTYGSWTATNVPVIGDGMYCFYLQAQPHSGNRASGLMQHHNAALDTEFPTTYNTAGFQLQAPYIRVLKYQADWFLDPGNGAVNGPQPHASGYSPPTQQFHYDWHDNALSSAWWRLQGQSLSCTTNFIWPYPDYCWYTAPNPHLPWLNGNQGLATNTCSTNFSYPLPFPMFFEHCNVTNIQTATNTQGVVINTNTFTRTADIVIELVTGGRPLVQGSGIFFLWAYATNMTNQRWPVFGDFAGTQVAPNNVIVGNLGPLQDWGYLYAGFPDNSTNNITLSFLHTNPTNDFYTYAIAQQKYTLEIFRDYLPATGVSRPAEVGSKINLLAMLQPADSWTPPITSYQWDVPGPTFAYYYADSNYAAMYPITATNGSNIVYYYRDETNAPAQCTAVALGYPVKNFSFASVSKPNARIDPRIFNNVTVDTNWFAAPGTYALHFGGASGIPGIQFSNSVNLDDTYFQWVQVGHAELEVLNNEDNRWYMAVGDGLDTGYPYPKQGLTRTANDNPGTKCVGNEVKCRMLLTMHLMYRPGNIEENMWVSLRTVDWAWSGDATNINGAFTLTDGGRGATADVPATNNPTWTTNIMSTWPRPLLPK